VLCNFRCIMTVSIIVDLKYIELLHDSRDIPRFSSKRNVVISSTVIIIENITMLVRLRAINV
jgi:hypothetical protein